MVRVLVYSTKITSRRNNITKLKQDITTAFGCTAPGEDFATNRRSDVAKISKAAQMSQYTVVTDAKVLVVMLHQPVIKLLLTVTVGVAFVQYVSPQISKVYN